MTKKYYVKVWDGEGEKVLCGWTWVKMLDGGRFRMPVAINKMIGERCVRKTLRGAKQLANIACNYYLGRVEIVEVA